MLPVPVTEEKTTEHIPEYNLHTVRSLEHFIAEDAKTTRKNLKLFGYPAIEKAQVHLLNEHTKKESIPSLLSPLLSGQDTGLMSDAGCPGIADPGADVIYIAHQKNISVIPLVGPSAIVLSIMASGFNGQNFAFVGYLPIDKAQKQKRIRELEQLCFKTKQAQFFIETPYRNSQLLELLLSTLNPQSKLFIGRGLQSPQQFVKSASVAEWKKMPLPQLDKVPVVFGLFC